MTTRNSSELRALAGRLRQAAGAAECLHVVCLCAAWCGTCRDYRATFDAAAGRHPTLRFSWIDIEDEAELVGDLDVETFPTLLVADPASVRFFGPLLPQPDHLRRLLASLQADGPP